MKMRSGLVIGSILIVVATMCVAQRTTVITIEAKDPSGAVVSGADVNAAATSPAQALTRVTRTGIDGTASLDLQPGTYDLTVNASGFRTVTKQVVIAAADRQTIAFVLQVDSCPPGPCFEVTPLNAPLPTGSYCSVPQLSLVPYPSKLIGSGIEGTVRLHLEVDERGCAHDIKVVKSVHPELDRAAKDAVKTWKFRSATKDGKAVRVLVEVDVPVKPTT